MTLFWILFGVLGVLTLVWVFLVRSDARAYIESQVKVLGEENRSYVDRKGLKAFFWFYCGLVIAVFAIFLFLSAVFL